MLLCPWDFPGKSIGVGCHFLLQRIFPTQGLNPGQPLIDSLCMRCSLGISNILEEISSLSHSVVFLYFFTLIAKEDFLISSCYSLELCILPTTQEKTLHMDITRWSMLKSDWLYSLQPKMENASSGKTRRVYTQLDKGPETPGTTREASGVPFLRQDEAWLSCPNSAQRV